MGNLGCGMNATVSTPRAVNDDGLTDDIRDRAFNFRLHGAPTNLPLPAIEVGSGILHDKSDPLRQVVSCEVVVLVRHCYHK